MTTKELNQLATDLAHDAGLYPNGAYFTDRYTLENTYIDANVESLKQLLLALQDKLRSVHTKAGAVSDDQLSLW